MFALRAFLGALFGTNLLVLRGLFGSGAGHGPVTPVRWLGAPFSLGGFEWAAAGVMILWAVVGAGWNSRLTLLTAATAHLTTALPVVTISWHEDAVYWRRFAAVNGDLVLYLFFATDTAAWVAVMRRGLRLPSSRH